jgi:hypothetical protein
VSPITNFVQPAEFLFQPIEKKGPFANPDLKPGRFSSICQPEQRFWKLSAQPVSPKAAVIESFVLILFLIVALVSVTSCCTELFHLIDSDAIGHVAMKAIGAAG